MWEGDAVCATYTQADARSTRRCVMACIGPEELAAPSPLPGPLSGGIARYGWTVALCRRSPETGVIGAPGQYVVARIAGLVLQVKTRH